MIIIEIAGYKEWKNGLYLISAGTGQGKNYWVMNELYDYVHSRGKRMIILTNRAILKRQTVELLKDETTLVSTYQRLEHNQVICGVPNLFNNPNNLMDALESFDYIVMDEAHYIFQDAKFNRNTETILHMVERYYQSKIIVMLTATPDILKEYYKSRGMLTRYYEFGADYSYIQNVYAYFASRNDVVKEIIQNIPRDEKIIFFGSNKNRLKELKSYYAS